MHKNYFFSKNAKIHPPAEAPSDVVFFSQKFHKFAPYIRFYLDAKYQFPDGIGTIHNYHHNDVIITAWFGAAHEPVVKDYYLTEVEFKPILRNLSSITEEEKTEYISMNANMDAWDMDSEWIAKSYIQAIGEPDVWVWLLSKGFWIFGEDENEWFENAWIIDAATIK